MDKRLRDERRAIDQIVADNVRRARLAAGKSQTQLGDALGLTFQQVQKYEKGVNRMSASVLVTFAEVLHVPLSQFFEGIETPHEAAIPDPIRALSLNRHGMRLARAFNGLNAKPGLCQAILELMEHASKE